MMSFQPLTPALLEQYLGPQTFTMRGWALMDEDKPVGVIGLYRQHGRYALFSDVREEVWPNPPPLATRRLIAQGIRRLRGIMAEHQNVYAYADEMKPGSDSLLEHMGFQQFRNRIYKWQPSSRSSRT
jgi:hypothetical protein